MNIKAKNCYPVEFTVFDVKISGVSEEGTEVVMDIDGVEVHMSPVEARTLAQRLTMSADNVEALAELVQIAKEEENIESPEFTHNLNEILKD